MAIFHLSPWTRNIQSRHHMFSGLLQRQWLYDLDARTADIVDAPYSEYIFLGLSTISTYIFFFDSSLRILYFFIEIFTKNTLGSRRYCLTGCISLFQNISITHVYTSNKYKILRMSIRKYRLHLCSSTLKSDSVPSIIFV